MTTSKGHVIDTVTLGRLRLYSVKGRAYIVRERRKYYPVNSSLRDVFNIAGHAFKIDARDFSDGRKFRRTTAWEVQTWEKIRKKDRKYFSPVLETGRLGVRTWVITPWYDLVEIPSDKIPNHIRKKVYTLTARYSISDVAEGFLYAHNYAMTKNDGLKIYDYGGAD